MNHDQMDKRIANKTLKIELKLRSNEIFIMFPLQIRIFLVMRSTWPADGVDNQLLRV
jgi:hypothetical protein